MSRSSIEQQLMEQKKKIKGFIQDVKARLAETQQMRQDSLSLSREDL